MTRKNILLTYGAASVTSAAAGILNLWHGTVVAGACYCAAAIGWALAFSITWRQP